MPQWIDRGEVEESGLKCRRYELQGGGSFIVQVDAVTEPNSMIGTYVTLSEKISPWTDEEARDYGKRIGEAALIALKREKRGG